MSQSHLSEKGCCGDIKQHSHWQKDAISTSKHFCIGVHPDTTVDDIIADSGIEVHKKAIKMKSKPEAFLNSYRISVRAEDLQKALNPAIRPMRVKVREYVFYSKKNAKSKETGQKQDGPVQSQANQQNVQQYAHNGQYPQYGAPYVPYNMGHYYYYGPQHQMNGQSAVQVEDHQ